MKSFPELTGSANPEAHDWAAGVREDKPMPTMAERIAMELSRGKVNKSANRQRPFDKDELLSGNSLETLRDWLSENVSATHLLAPEYSVDDLVTDIDKILVGMWNDGIDAMGEDS